MNKIKSYKKLATGFTLTELLVVIGIMSIMAATIVLTFHGYQAKRNLEITAQDIKFNLGEALHNTLVYPDANGYGLIFTDSTHFVLFKDGLTGNINQYDAGEEIGGVLKTSSGIYVSSTWPMVLFIVPKDNWGQYSQETLSNLTPDSDGNITITLTDGTNNKNIIINIYANTINIT